MSRGLQVIGMIKDMKQRYLVDGERLTLKELYNKLPKSKNVEVIGSLRVQTTCGLPVKLVFVQNRNCRREWLVILSTDLELDEKEIVRIYGMRWSIETFFKFTKSHLKLGTEFQGRSFDMLISHTTIVFARYSVLEWERRQQNDTRSLGGLFFLYSDEIRNLEYQTALQQLIVFFLDLLGSKHKQDKSAVLSQVQQWIASLPSYIKGLFAKLSCES